jgi:hypothetical protein
LFFDEKSILVLVVVDKSLNMKISF